MLTPREMITRCGRNFPSKVAFICGKSRATWAQMNQRSDRLGAALQMLGLNKGDVTAILSQERIEIHEHFYACMKIGAIRVGVNPRFAWSEIRHVLSDSKTRFLFVEARCKDIIDAHRAEIDQLKVTLIGLGQSHSYALDYETLLQRASAPPALPALLSDDPLYYSYTSGTTGLPKGVILTHGGLANVILHSLVSFGFSPDDVWFNPSGSSWATIALSALNLGNAMTVAIPDGSFDVGEFFRNVEQSRATVAMLVPTVIQRVIKDRPTTTYDASSLRMVIYGSAPTAPKLIRDASTVLGVDLLQTSVLTETTGGWVTYLTNKDHLLAFDSRPELLSSVGRVGPHFECSVRDDNGKSLPPRAKGEIWLRGKAVMKGYLNRAQETAEVLCDDWLRSNDIGFMDEDGFVYLLDRQKYMIITGGLNVYPSAVEAVLAEHPAVQEVAVVGGQHPEWGEAVVAFVKLVDDAATVTVQDLVGFCREHLSGHQVPKHVIFVSELPKTTTAKVKKFELMRLLAENPYILPWNVAP